VTTTPTSTGYRARRVRRLGMPPESRDVRIVHHLDGILDDVQPGVLLRTGAELWNAWVQHSDFQPPDVLLGLDAGGMLPTVAISVASGVPYRLAWKLDLDLPAKRRFTEQHARRTEVFTYGELAGRRVLIIDDEVTTGRTVLNLASVLQEAGALVVGVACLVEDTAGDARTTLESAWVPLCALSRL
jgi:adenine phosphoribosyltransferase